MNELIQESDAEQTSTYLISMFLKESYVCTGEKKDFYFFNGNRWIYDDLNTYLYDTITIKMVRKVKDFLSDILRSEDTEDDGEAIIEKGLKYCKHLRKRSFINECKYHVGQKLRDKLFLQKLDSNPNLLGFENGVLDLVSGTFRQGQPQDYISYSCGYDYIQEPEEDTKTDEINNFLSQVHPNKDIQNYLLDQLSQALSGRQKKHLIHFHTGSGGNGKSILCKLMEVTLGDYCRKVDVSLFTQRNKDTHSKGIPLLHSIQGRRFIYASEPKNNDKLNDSVLKDLSSGEKITYRLLNGNTVFIYTPQFHIHIFCNKLPAIKSQDGGLSRRVRVLPYTSCFVSARHVDPDKHKYLIDYDLEQKIPHWKLAFMKLLLSRYSETYVDNPPEPVVTKSESYVGYKKT
jgi:P4 family phage/plasmid primase-like protien